MGQIFKVEFLRRCARATGGITCVPGGEEGRGTDMVLKLTVSQSHGALSTMQRWAWGPCGTEAPVSVAFFMVRLTFLQVQGHWWLFVATYMAALYVTGARGGVRV